MQHTPRLLALVWLLGSTACGGGFVSTGDDAGATTGTSGSGTSTSGGTVAGSTQGTGTGTTTGGSTTVITDSNGTSSTTTTVSGRESWVWVYTSYATSLSTIAANPNAFTHISPTFYSLNYNYTTGVAYYANCPTSSAFICSGQGTNDFDTLTTAQFTSQAKALGMQVIPAIYAGAANNGVDTGQSGVEETETPVSDNRCLRSGGRRVVQYGFDCPILSSRTPQSAPSNLVKCGHGLVCRPLHRKNLHTKR